jgi:hypothetical protein
MSERLKPNEIAEALDELIAGNIVKRSKHSLLWEGRNITRIFIERLLKNGFNLQTVDHTNIDIGFRCPAFWIQHEWAYFGWVKWMKYDEGIYWKYFASEVRKPSGSSIYVYTSDDPEQIYVNDSIQEETDLENSSMYE